jgi:hypothetical protein
MWIPSHVGLVGNELVDERMRKPALEGDFQNETRRTLVGLPILFFQKGEKGQKKERRFVCTVSRVLSGHCSVRSHLGRCQIVEDLMCVCVQVSLSLSLFIIIISFTNS